MPTWETTMNSDEGEYRIARFRERLARDDVAELGVRAEMRGAAVVLTGTLPTADRRDEVLRIADAELSGLAVRADLLVACADPPTGPRSCCDDPERAGRGVVRVAAVGDIHLSPDCGGLLRPSFATLPLCADVLLLAGDLTRHGTVPEAEVVAEEVRDLGVPVVAVLGNHDYHSEREADVGRVLTDAGVTVLEGDRVLLPVAGGKIGIAGVKGFCGGFAGRSAGEFGEREMKEFVRTARRGAEGLYRALSSMDGDGCAVRIALTHFAPVPDTLAGEPVEIYPFLGSYPRGGHRRGGRRPRGARPCPPGDRARYDGGRGTRPQRRPARHPQGLRPLPPAAGPHTGRGTVVPVGRTGATKAARGRRLVPRAPPSSTAAAARAAADVRPTRGEDLCGSLDAECLQDLDLPFGTPQQFLKAYDVDALLGAGQRLEGAPGTGLAFDAQAHGFQFDDVTQRRAGEDTAVELEPACLLGEPSENHPTSPHGEAEVGHDAEKALAVLGDLQGEEASGGPSSVPRWTRAARRSTATPAAEPARWSLR